MTTLITYFISSLKVSIKHRKHQNKTRHSKFIELVAEKLVKEGVLKGYTVGKEGPINYLYFEVSRHGKDILMYDIKIVSTPGRRIYSNYSELKKFKQTYPFILVSTSKGILNYQECIRNKTGGEVICKYI